MSIPHTKKRAFTFRAVLFIAAGMLLSIGLFVGCKDNATQEFQKSQNDLFKPQADPNSFLKTDTTTLDTTPTP